MKLEIDLMNADEVKAGLSLLARVSEAQAETSASMRTAAKIVGVASTPVFSAGAEVFDSATTGPTISQLQEENFIQRTQVPDGEEFFVPGDQPFATDGMNPAAVFGGTPVADPLPSSTIVPPPPVSIVPTTPIPGPASSVAAVELDGKGLPWDSRIHSSSKNKLANGCWKVARGKAAEYVAAIEHELRAPTPEGVRTALAGVVITPPPAIPSPPSPAIAAPVVPLLSAVPQPPAPNADPSTFETLMPRISPQISAGVLPPQAVMEACKANGLQSVVGLQSSPQLVPLVWATLKATYPALV